MRGLKYYIVIIMLMPFAAMAQQVYYGTTIDATTKQPLPFVTVTLVKENVIASTNDSGNFRLVSKKRLSTDSLLFTYVGYIPVKIAANTLAKNRTIQIKADEVLLNQVEISAKQVKKKLIKLNDFTLYNNDSIEVLNPAYYKNMVQAAIKFSSPKNTSTLKSVRLARKIRFPSYKTSYDYRNGRCRFRLKIYDVDPLTGGPGKEICKDTIELQNKRNTFIEVDLSSYNIAIHSKEFFIAVEWLIIPYNETITTSYVEVALHGKGYKSSYTDYTLEYDPVLYGVRLEGKEKKSKTWLRYNYGSNWVSGAQMTFNTNIALSATVEVSKE